MYKTEAQIKLETPKMDGNNPQGFGYVNNTGSDNRMAEGYEGIPDSGLANEYIRLQDDFMKWQQQLLQNQQLLHNRVAPIAANPPTLNSVGLVNNMIHQSASGPSEQHQRKPVEITIPIRLVDSDEEDTGKTSREEPVSNQTLQRPMQMNQVNAPSGSRWNGPSVPVDSWQEKPSYVIVTQPTVIEPSMSRPFPNQPRMQTVFQSVPNDVQNRETVIEQPSFQQKPQQQQYKDNVVFAQQNVPRPEFYQMNQPQSNFQQEPQTQFRQAPQKSFQKVPQQNHLRNENQEVPFQNYEQFHQPNYHQTPVYNSHSAPESNVQKLPEQNTQFATRAYPQNLTRQQQPASHPMVDKSDEGINARFSSVVTLSNDKNDENVPQKDKVRSVVQLNNSSPQVSQNSVPFNSKIINAANKNANDRERDGSLSFQPSDSSSVAPISSRLVQQAVQQPFTGNFRVSPPKVEQCFSPPKFEQRSSPPRIEQYYSPPLTERQPSPPKPEQLLPFGEVKLRHVESPRVSPPKSSVLEPLVAPPPPPPPPPSKASAGTSVPPPPPPPIMSEADRRAATGKKILGAAYAPQLDAREELMMAIRQFGGSQNLRKSAHPPPR